MSENTNGLHKTNCDHCKKHLGHSSQKIDSKITNRPRRVIVSKNIHATASHEGKNGSTGRVNRYNKGLVENGNKTTKSDQTFARNNIAKKKPVDLCAECGDAPQDLGVSAVEIGKIVTDKFSDISTMVQKQGKSNQEANSTKSKINKKAKKNCSSVRQYYRNENFQVSAESIKEPKKCSLRTIKEASERCSAESSNDDSDCFIRIYSDSDEEKITVDPDNIDTLKELKEFREENYFECHSSMSRIQNKASVTSLKDHKCVYRFYLNDRLFPVPLCTDHNNTIRCVECYLPLEKENGSDGRSLNGTIQAKVKIGNDEEAKDVTLFLPVREHLIVKEKRVEKNKPQDEVMYFGVVKLGDDGNSIFNPTLPSNSLALKYQKGYKELTNIEEYKYDSVDKNNVIII